MAKSPPSGAIPLIEAQCSHREFIDAVEPAYALVKLTTARQLLKREETAESYFPPETEMITTSTVEDTKLNLISWEQELAIVADFQPTYHIPADYSTYQEQDPADRQANVEACLEGTLWMARRVCERDLNTTVIPLVKGCTSEEWALSYAVFDRAPVEFPMIAFFATQYFTGGAGIRINELVEDVREIATKQHRAIMLIGLLSANYLERMPRAVRAGTGLNQWRQPISPRKQTDEEMYTIWKQVSDEVVEALGQPGATEYVDPAMPAEQEVV